MSKIDDAIDRADHAKVEAKQFADADETQTALAQIRYIRNQFTYEGLRALSVRFMEDETIQVLTDRGTYIMRIGSDDDEYYFTKMGVGSGIPMVAFPLEPLDDLPALLRPQAE